MSATQPGIRRAARWLALGLAFSLVAAACGDDDDDVESSDVPAETTTAAPTADDGGTDTTETTTPTDTTETTEAPVAAGPPPEAPGFDGTNINLGYLTDQSGALSIVGVPLLAGAQAYWSYVNEELGGIGGQYPVQLVTGDTKDDEATTVQEYLRIKDDVVMIGEVLSTPPTQAVLEFLEEDGILATPGSLAGAWNSEPNLVPNGTAYEYEMINLADWFINQSGLGDATSAACLVYVNDKYGEDARRGLDYAAEQLGFELAAEVTIARGDTDFTAQVGELQGAGCEVVYAITVPREQNGLLATANAQGFDPIWLGALPSYLNLLTAGDNAALYENFYVALDTPGLDDTSVPGMANFLERWAAYGDGSAANTFQLSGYFQSISIHALLEAAVANGDLSREGLQAALAGLGEVEMDGLADNWVYGAPEDRVPATASRIFQFDATVPPNFLREVAQIESELNAGLEL